jgi:hypothetical protein
VNTWQDQSGNGYHSIGINSPVFTASNASFGSRPTIMLQEVDYDYLRIEDDADKAPKLHNTSELSVFFVFNSNNSSGVRRLLSKRDGNASQQFYVFFAKTEALIADLTAITMLERQLLEELLTSIH